MKKHSKRYDKAVKAMGEKRLLPLPEAIMQLRQAGAIKFDEAVEIAVKLGIDAKKSEQAVRGSISLPKGIGKELKVIAFAEGKKAEEAKEAGAMEVGSAELAKKIEGGWLDFDVAVATPDMMRHVGKLGKVLGPQGKMPSPKAGTVTPDIGQAVKEFRAGKIEFRADETGNVHALVGKRSFSDQDLQANIEAFLDYLKVARPAAAKGNFIQKVALSFTMSPSVSVELAQAT